MPNAPLRIGIIANSVDSFALDRAGGFVHLVETAKRWNGVRLVVMAPTSAEYLFRRYLHVDRFIAIPDFGNGASAVSQLLRAAASVAAVKKLRTTCDVVMAMSHSIPDALPAVLFGRSRAAAQFWHFIGNPLSRPGSVLRNLLAFANEVVGRSLAQLCRCYIVGSPYLLREMRVNNRPYTYVTTNGVDEQLPGVQQIGEGAMFVGRLHPAKGVDELLDAWRIVHTALPRERLTIVGRGLPQFRAQLERTIDEYALRDVVTIRDDVSNDEKLRLLSSARVFVFPSKEEGWGIALAEAMASGLPCVTYELPPFAEIFPGGRVSTHIGDVNGFAANVINVLQDASLREKLSKEALLQARRFTWQRAAEIELRALREIAP